MFEEIAELYFIC